MVQNNDNNTLMLTNALLRQYISIIHTNSCLTATHGYLITNSFFNKEFKVTSTLYLGSITFH